MRERIISETLIVKTLFHPTKQERDRQGRALFKKLYWRRGKRRLLLLAMEREGNGWCVVTVIDTTKVKKYL